VGQRRDGFADPRGAGVPAALRAAFVINRRVSTTVIGREARNRSPISRCPRCARRCISASSSPTAWPLAGSHARGIGARPPANPHAEAWIRQGDADALGKGDLYTARLTLDITPAMRARIKVSAFTQGVTVADLLRGLLEREFPPENTP
jgi:hypothetical protein